MCTQAEYRGRGVATEMITQAMRALHEAGCDIAFLGADVDKLHLDKLYGKFGFRRLNRPYFYVGKSGQEYFEEDGMIAPVNSLDKFTEIMESSEKFGIGHGNW